MLLCSRTMEVADTPLDKRHKGWRHLRGPEGHAAELARLREQDLSDDLDTLDEGDDHEPVVDN